MNRAALGLIGFLIASQASAVEYLTELETQPVEVPGMVAADILKRAKVCIVENTAPAYSNEVIVEDGGSDSSVMAVVKVGYSKMIISYVMRARMKVMAKDGKFKIKQTDIERLTLDTGSMPNMGYSPVGKWLGSGYEAAKKTMEDYAGVISACIAKAPEPEAENW